MRRAVATALASAALAGCGGVEDSRYGTMSRYVATQRIHEVAREVLPPRLELARVRKGANQAGRPAWVGVFRDPAGEQRPVCVAVWDDATDPFHWEWDHGDCAPGGGPGGV